MVGGTNKKHMVKYEVDVSEGLQVSGSPSGWSCCEGPQRRGAMLLQGMMRKRDVVKGCMSSKAIPAAVRAAGGGRGTTHDWDALQVEEEAQPAGL